jgi:hypothetical protein
MAPSMIGAPVSAAVPRDRAETVFIQMLYPAGEEIGDEALVAAQHIRAEASIAS